MFLNREDDLLLAPSGAFRTPQGQTHAPRRVLGKYSLSSMSIKLGELRGRNLVMSALVTFLCGIGVSSFWFQNSAVCNAPVPITTSLNANGHILEDGIRCSVGGDVKLRILPIGDSITVGWGNSEYWNSYRKDLQLFLDSDCPMRNHTYIGSQLSGNFANNNHEGYAGYTINEIMYKTQPHLTASIMEYPNVVLLHAGTNDMSPFHGDPYETAPDRLGSLMDLVLLTVPNVTVLVAQIVQPAGANNTRTGLSGRVPEFNAQIPRIAAERVAKGFKVQVVDMNMIGGGDGSDLLDDLHPNDKGYRKMAVKWFEALQNATQAGLITPPKEVFPFIPRSVPFTA